MTDTEDHCHHTRGKIVSYTPWLEVCYECGQLLEGDPRHGEQKVLNVPQAVVDGFLGMRSFL